MVLFYRYGIDSMFLGVIKILIPGLFFVIIPGLIPFGSEIGFLEMIAARIASRNHGFMFSCRIVSSIVSRETSN